MTFRFSVSHFLSTFGLLAALAACSGMTGPAGNSAGGGPVGGGQTLDAGGGPVLGGGNGGDVAGTGGAVPSTQQSDPAVGAPCGAGIQVLVRVIENGYVRYCDGRTGPRAEFADAVVNTGGMTMKALMRNDTFDPGEGEFYDEPVDYNPKIVIHFLPENGVFGEKNETKDASCQSDGFWSSQFTLRWGYTGRRCADFRLTASATLRSAGVHFSSPTWSGTEFPEDSEGNRQPILLVIDRGRTAP